MRTSSRALKLSTLGPSCLPRVLLAISWMRAVAFSTAPPSASARMMGVKCRDSGSTPSICARDSSNTASARSDLSDAHGSVAIARAHKSQAALYLP